MNSHKRHKPSLSIIITMLLLFSTGQVLAVAHAHTMNHESQPQTMSQDCGHMSEQGQNSHAMNDTTMSSMSDCCETLCQCPQAMCSTVLLLPAKVQSTQFYLLKPMTHWLFTDGFHLNKDHSPLYRPPII